MTIESKIDELTNLQQKIDETITLEEMVDGHIVNTLVSMSANRTHTAEALGIHLRSLRNKIVELKAKGYEIPKATKGIKKNGG